MLIHCECESLSERNSYWCVLYGLVHMCALHTRRVGGPLANYTKCHLSFQIHFNKASYVVEVNIFHISTSINTAVWLSFGAKIFEQIFILLLGLVQLGCPSLAIYLKMFHCLDRTTIHLIDAQATCFWGLCLWRIFHSIIFIDDLRSHLTIFCWFVSSVCILCHRTLNGQRK